MMKFKDFEEDIEFMFKAEKGIYENYRVEKITKDNLEAVHRDGLYEGMHHAMSKNWINKNSSKFFKIIKEVSFPETANVQHPSHYAGTYGIECIEAIKNALTKDGFSAYIRGNILKYAWRAPNKNNLEDIKKIKMYCDLLLEAEGAE